MLASGFAKLVVWNALLCGAPLLCGQSVPVGRPATSGPETSTYHPHLTYDVASIREYRSNGGMRYIDDMPHNSYFHAEGVSLFGLILGAYDLKLAEQVENLPHGAHDTMYTIDAKSDEATDAALEKLSDSNAWAEKRHMLQVLLAERFHLQIHPETRTTTIYELITTTRTAKLMTPVKGDVGKTVSTCSPRFSREKGAEIDSKGCPFDIFFQELQQYVGTEVVNHTGMTGMYAFQLMWWPARLPEDDYPSADRYPPLKDAVHEQLGLELKPTKGPMTFWVVDHSERPTQN